MTASQEIQSYYSAILPFYDASLRDRADLPFWDSIAGRWGSGTVLEAGCGTGRVTAVLSRYGSVVAFVLLIEMLSFAARAAPAAALAALDLHRLALDARFELIVLADDPMAHLTSSNERARVLKSIGDHLAPGGRVVIEGLYRRHPGSSTREVTANGELLTIDERWEPASETTWLATYRYRKGAVLTEASSLLRSWREEELMELAGAGLRLEHLWGDFDQNPFQPASPRMLIVAEKPKD